MANTAPSLLSDKNMIIFKEKEITYQIIDLKHLKKFYKWVRKNKLNPGDIIPKKIFNECFRRI